MTLERLLYIIASEYYETRRRGVGRTRLLKLAYLADVFYARLTSGRLSDADWMFWHYGPYVSEYPQILESHSFKVDTKGDIDTILPAPEVMTLSMSNDEELAISRAMKLADEDFYELLDFVYFDTEPMVNVNKRGQKLDFSCVKPEAAYLVRRYTIGATDKDRISKRMQELRAKNAGR